MSETPSPPKVAVIGGGLAGMAAALRLAEEGLNVELFEARQALGGRAASYRDPTTGELIDHCQHVAMACCTNFHDFCGRVGIASEFDRYSTLHFFSPEGRRYDLKASRWLPPPLHLAPALLRQGYLTLGERLSIGRALLQLRDADTTTDESIGAWLRRNGQSPQAIARFWSVVLVSALGESIDNAALLPARKVFVDGFMRHRDGYQVDVPKRALRELFDEQAAQHLERLGVRIHRRAQVESLVESEGRVQAVVASGQTIPADAVVLAVPWRRAGELLLGAFQKMSAQLSAAATLGASPITGVHLWFDRSITALPHAVLVDRLSQWVFRRELGETHYYQVVISASRDLRGVPAGKVVDQVTSDLAAIFPEARDARLLASKVVTEQEAVFSYRVGCDQLRPAQRTSVPNLFLAGDWTQTGWPSTLESAARSGYLAAEEVLELFGRPKKLLADDL